MKNKLEPELFDITYKRKNVAKSDVIKSKIYRNFEEYKEKIYNNNRLDLKLYKFVKDKIFSEEKMKWINRTDYKYEKMRHGFATELNQELIGRIYRNLYIGPIINVIRAINGLKLGGSYRRIFLCYLTFTSLFY